MVTVVVVDEATAAVAVAVVVVVAVVVTVIVAVVVVDGAVDVPQTTVAVQAEEIVEGLTWSFDAID